MIESPMPLAYGIENRVARAILSGDLIPIMVFGTDECCEHGPDAEDNRDCRSTGFGLCDRFSKHAPGGSDCNRANHYMLRPSDALMDDAEVQAALDAVLERNSDA
jgi:hypothetical protein